MALLKSVVDAIATAVAQELTGARQTDPAPDVSASFANDSLARTIDWVKFADAKAGTVLVIVGLLLTNALSKADILLRAYRTEPWQGDWVTASFAASLVAAGLTVVFVTLVLYPHVKAKTKSIAFFGQAAGMSHEEYERDIRRLTAASSVIEICNQVWEVSRIARQKFRWLRWAYGSALCFLILYTCSRLLLTWKGGL